MMTKFVLPAGAVPADLQKRVRLQVLASVTEPPEGRGWLHEIKHDGHRLVAIVADGAVKLLSRNARDRTELFGEPFRALAAAGLPAMVLDGEIAVPDARGVTHIEALTEAMRQRGDEQLAYFAFDLLYLDRHDLRACAIEVAAARHHPRRRAARAWSRLTTSSATAWGSSKRCASSAPRGKNPDNDYARAVIDRAEQFVKQAAAMFTFTLAWVADPISAAHSATLSPAS